MGTLNVNKIVPASSVLTLNGACTVNSSTVFNKNISIVNMMYSSGLVTLLGGAYVDGKVQCSVSPTQSYHLVNKDYIDSWMNGLGKVVWFGAYTNSTPGNYYVSDTVTLPVGNYKIYAEGIFNINLVSSNSGFTSTPNGKATITINWKNTDRAYPIIASDSVGMHLYSSGGGCGGAIGQTKQNGIVGVLSDLITIDSIGPRTFNISCDRTDGGNVATFDVVAVKIYIFTAE